MQKADGSNNGLLPAWTLPLVLLGAIVACGASTMLAWQHLSSRALPGCGPEAACATLSAHPLGSLGGLVAGFDALSAGESLINVLKGAGRAKVAPEAAWWPVSFIGAAYFAGLFCAACLAGRRPGAWKSLTWIVRAGGVLTVVLGVVIVVANKYCAYCIAAHIGNVLAWGALEVGLMLSKRDRAGMEKTTTTVPRGGGVMGLAAMVVATTIASGALGAFEHRRLTELRDRAEASLRDSEKALAEKMALDREAAAAQPASKSDDIFGPNGLTGRWRTGPEKAVARIVVISSYQCAQCRRIELEALALTEKYKDKVSYVAKHFPICTDCNPFTGGSNMHPNSCWAARAAETAGLLKGNDGFWAMHKWLFDKGGAFTEEEFAKGLVDLGYTDPSTFVTIMTSDAPLLKVKEDIEEAHKMGLWGTPMVFVNGVELRGWEAPKALERAVETVLAANPPAMSAANDRPPSAKEKWIGDWRESPVLNIAADKTSHSLGNANAKVEILIFGDMAEKNTARLHELLIKWIQEKKDIRYTFRWYVGDKGCNPALPKTVIPGGCLSAQAAEAAALIGGEEAYWKMHTWLLANMRVGGLDLSGIKRGALEMGMDLTQLEQTMSRPEVAAAIADDIGVANAIGVTAIPGVYVNNKLVKWWEREGDLTLERIINEALAK